MLIMTMLFTLSCAHVPIPESSCVTALSKVSGPDSTLRHVHVACERFYEQTGYTPDLSGVSVTVASGEASRAILKKEPEIFVNHLSKKWERELYHEVWHVLLWRSEPLLPTSAHHSTMLRYKLCYPMQLCGYGHNYSAW